MDSLKQGDCLRQTRNLWTTERGILYTSKVSTTIAYPKGDYWILPDKSWSGKYPSYDMTVTLIHMSGRKAFAAHGLLCECFVKDAELDD